MRLRYDKKRVKMGEFTEFPDYSFNHYYNNLGDDEADVYYLEAENIEDAKKSMYPKAQISLFGV